MSLTWSTGQLPAPPFPEKPLSNDATMERFFAVALGTDKRAVTDHVVQELRRVLREDVNSELAEAWVEDDPGECWSLLQVRWYGESTFSEVALFWSLD
jgi:hypothetical protein